MRGHDTRRARPAARGGRGFSVIEVIIVIFVVMILAGMVAPAVARGVRTTKLREAASETATAIRRARSLAIATGEIHSAEAVPVASAPGGRALVFIDRKQDLTDVGTRAAGFMLPAGVTFTTSNPKSLEEVNFLPDGSIVFVTAPGVTEEIWIVPEDQSLPHYDKPHYVISFRQLTGRIEVGELGE